MAEAQANGIESIPVNERGIVFNVKDQGSNPLVGSEDRQVVLGDLINNPFSVSNILQAHANLYPEESNAYIVPTAYHLKFTPANVEELKILIDSDLDLYDYPLNMEIITDGGHYQNLSPDDIPSLYTIVDVNAPIPPISYVVLDEYYFDEFNPILIAESFVLSGNEDEVEEYTGIPASFVIDGRLDRRKPLCPEGCELITWIDDSEDPPIVNWFCDCDGPPPPPAPIFNDCGCPVFKSIRKPAGCIYVEDTQYSDPADLTTFEPVRRVKVTAKNKFGKSRSTYADDDGCWKINEEFKGKIKVKIRFTHDRAKIRGVRKLAIQFVTNYLTPVTFETEKISGPVFNDVGTYFHMWGEKGSRGHLYWGASTVNNALHEFHDNAASDGINPPPMGMDMYVGWKESYGYAIMRKQMGAIAVMQALNSGISSSSTFIQPFAAFSPLEFIITMFAPDVFVGIDRITSDNLKDLAYHEIAHSSHYTKAGRSFWQALIESETTAEIVNGDPHGISTSNGAGYISVAESWAEFLGLTYLDRRYSDEEDTSITGTYGDRIGENTQ